jgi:hypothetical protein
MNTSIIKYTFRVNQRNVFDRKSKLSFSAYVEHVTVLINDVSMNLSIGYLLQLLFICLLFVVVCILVSVCMQSMTAHDHRCFHRHV